MNILLVRNYPLIDGTLTLLIRIARRMNENGDKAYMLFLTGMDPKIEQELKGNVEVLTLNDLQAMHHNKALPVIDVIHGVISGDAIILTFSLLKGKYFPGASIVMGAYHPYFLREQREISFTPDALLHRTLMARMPDANIIFMNDAVKEYVESYFNKAFAHSQIIPLPVEVKKAYTPRARIDKRKIVSVGRLVDMKNYPLGVIRALCQLNKNGINFEYHIYGTGPLQPQIEEQITTLGLESQVFMHGDLQYSKVAETIKDALLFVGMGTAIIEAAALGIPSLLAIGAKSDKCYGLFHEMQGYTVGEPLTIAREYDYEQCIKALVLTDENEYERLSILSYQKALRFEESEVMQQYYKFYQHADKDFDFYIPKWIIPIMKLLRQPFKLFPKKISY